MTFSEAQEQVVQGQRVYVGVAVIVALCAVAAWLLAVQLVAFGLGNQVS